MKYDILNFDEIFSRENSEKKNYVKKLKLLKIYKDRINLNFFIFSL
jgi:hypothetical protein